MRYAVPSTSCGNAHAASRHPERRSCTRLWPLSRRNHPKQFLALLGEHSLYQETVLRAMMMKASVEQPVKKA